MKKLTCILLIMVMVMSMAACSALGVTMPEATPVPDIAIPEMEGPTMQDVYELAVSVGYTGTLDELIALFKGADGKDGKNGKDGTDGLTPYIGENGNWWIGDADLGVAAKGADGKDGADGKNGTDGLTPYVGNNGNWWIGETDLGVAASGGASSGAEGKSAYQLYKEKYGYKGTEEEWLNDLINGNLGTKETHTVSFVVNGYVAKRVEVEHGEKVADPALVVGGKLIESWLCNGEYWSFIGYTVTEDMTLEANMSGTPATTTKPSPQPSTPAETPPETVGDGRPEEPTWENYTKRDKNSNGEYVDNWVFEINKSTAYIAVDGVIEKEAYFNVNDVSSGYEGTAIYLVSEISSTPAGWFDLFFTADDTHIYVFYEFTKTTDPKIFWNDALVAEGRSYWLDCVDFCIDLLGRAGYYNEFRIFANAEGGVDSINYFNGGAIAAGVDDLYVKHTDKGYNVEFSIPLDIVHGKDDNGDKMISFTAMSTITISMTPNSEGSYNVGRSYSVASCSAGTVAKDQPSYLVIKGSAGDSTPPMTDDGRYSYTLNAGTKALAIDGEMDTEYASGLSWTAKYDLPKDNGNSGLYIDATKNTFDFYMAADADYVYGLYVIQDDRIVGRDDASAWYRADCANFIYSLAGDPTKYSEVRIFGNVEGDVGTIDLGPNNAILPVGMVDAFVKRTDLGYNVEFKLDRATFEDSNMFCFLAMMGSCPVPKSEQTNPNASVSCYPAIDNAAAASGTTARAMQNQVVIVDVATPGAPATTAKPATPAAPEGTQRPSANEGKPTANTPYTSLTERGNWIFEIDKSETALAVDGMLDEAYENGIVLLAERNLPSSRLGYESSEATLYVYATADDTHIYFLYEIIKDGGIIYWDADYTSKFHFDCIDFVLNPSGAEASGNEFRIMGAFEGGNGVAEIHGSSPDMCGVDDWYVRHTENGYNVEFSIPLDKVVGSDANGNKKISFTALSTITLDWPEGQTSPIRAYTCAAKGSVSTNEDKANPNILVIKGSADGSTPPMTDDGRYSYTLNASAETLSGYNDAITAAKVKDSAFSDGLVLEAMYASGSSYEFWNEDNDYTLYMAADPEYVYFFFDVKDSNIVNCADDPSVNAVAIGGQFWWNDGAVVYITYDGCSDYNSASVKQSVMFWAESEGTNHYTVSEQKNNSLKNAISNGYLERYTVNHVTGGYTVLAVYKRDKMTDNSFMFNVQVTLGDIQSYGTNGALDTYGRSYVAVQNASCTGGNNTLLNTVNIIDAK